MDGLENSSCPGTLTRSRKKLQKVATTAAKRNPGSCSSNIITSDNTTSNRTELIKDLDLLHQEDTGLNIEDSQLNVATKERSVPTPNSSIHIPAIDCLNLKMDTLKIKKMSIEGRLDRLANFIKNANINTQELKLRYDLTKPCLKEFIEIQLQIQTAEPTDVDEVDNFENKYFRVMAEADSIILLSSQNAFANQAQNSEESGLPKIMLPRFSGSYDEWLPFFNKFKSVVHDRASISNEQKFHYLISCLHGDAAELIANSVISEESYEAAWSLIVNTFDNKRKMVQSHISAIVEFPAITREDGAALQKLVRVFKKHIQALNLMKRPVNESCDLICYMVKQKIDRITAQEWERSIGKNEFPTIETFFNYLQKKAEALELTPPEIRSSKVAGNSNVNSVASNCQFCKGEHPISGCNKFLKLSIEERFNKVKDAKMCINCLKRGSHMANQCRSAGCSTCGKRHHKLLHREIITSQVTLALARMPDTMLSTAIVKVIKPNGEMIRGRALLDNGAQTNLVSREFVKKLGIPEITKQITIKGFNGLKSEINSKATLEIKSCIGKYATHIDCLVVPLVMEDPVPLHSFQKDYLNIPKNLKLADPKFYETGTIDILLGTKLFWKLLCVGRIILGDDLPCLQKTHLGWILGGGDEGYESRKLGCLTVNADIHFNLEKFWALEEPYIINEKQHSIVENFFNDTVTRNSEGRFVVKLPFKESETSLGRSKRNAENRFLNMECRFLKNHKLYNDYKAFMKEYESLGHMRKLRNPDCNKPHYYIPHHAVIRADSITTKLRVVFDASAKTENGPSLNDLLMGGPVIQQDLFSILVRFRTFIYALTADIVKMYRQVLVHPEQTQFQRIIWRENPNADLKTYELFTVTYGTVPASFLATRCLTELGEQNRDSYPYAAEVIANDFYIDDLLTGFDSVSEGVGLRENIIAILKSGGFELNKFNSNREELVSDIADNDSVIILNKDESNKVLGLRWRAADDNFNFKIVVPNHSRMTKRGILSQTASIFDPLGLINPTIVIAKLVIQEIWKLKLSWDEEVPKTLPNIWVDFLDNLKYLDHIAIPRTIVKNHLHAMELVGFADASEKAYGACVYLRTRDGSNKPFSVQLLSAKSRVSPIKKETIPRLELCAALLLAELMQKIKQSIRKSISSLCYYSDSKIVLDWLKGGSDSWKQYVSHRVAKILNLTRYEDWNYVRSRENPADIVSRGMLPDRLMKCSLWWNGPEWLINENISSENDERDQQLYEIPERRVIRTVALVTRNNFKLFELYSSLTMLEQVTAYCLRFINNCKRPDKKATGSLSLLERQNACKVLIKLVQQSEFETDISDLKLKSTVSNSSKLKTLNPFLDDNDIIRVGGRLENANISFSQRHPIVLPAQHKYTQLIYDRAHKQNLHAGAQGTLAFVRQRFWPLGAKHNIKMFVRRCIVCAKNKPIIKNQIMGNLPSSRVIVSRPFTNCGVDFCGPFYIKQGKRGDTATKAYVSIFICLAVKACHMELVSNLSSEAFVAAMRRMIARRGMITNMYSDNGTNFVGANKELRVIMDQPTLLREFTQVNWHFLPPHAPHMGGIWEATVKSAKHHIKRTVGDTRLNFEEFTTLLNQIEAILNSRPLTPISDDPNDLSCLTPGHFLIGAPMTALQDEDVANVKVNRLSRWQHIQYMSQQFWKRWKSEYLSQLQTRSKWYASKGEYKIGQLAIIHEDHIPPSRWRLGRIIALHPGTDRVVRVVTLRTAKGVIKRAINRVCLLPIDSEK